METGYKTVSCVKFFAILIAFVPLISAAAEVDFSCMKEQVRPIIQVTDQHQEFDVVIRNQCPGAAYWSVCIERMNPWTHEVVETHTPSGYVEAEKRARVNLQMKATPSPYSDENRAQAFYVSHAYDISEPRRAACVASQCEARKKDLRAEASRNSRAWSRAKVELQETMEAECPDDGWSRSDADTCRRNIADGMAEQMAAYAATDAELREQLAAIDPETCTVHGGSILELNKVN
jgi:hypothetical protein